MENSFNIADAIVLIILALSIYISYKRGIIKTLFSFGSTILSLILAKLFYPYVSSYLRTTWIFDSIKKTVFNAVSLSGIEESVTLNAQTELINSLNVPDIFKTGLLQNNNSEIYKLFNATGIIDYICSYVSNIIINVISIISVFLLVFIAMKILSLTLDIFSRLPVIKTANNLLGAVFGFFQGTAVIWILFIVITIFFTGEKFKNIYNLIGNSLIAVKFYDNNILMNMILKIFF